MSEIKDLSRQIDHNNLTYYFKSKGISPINFIGFKAPMHLYRDIEIFCKSRRRSKTIQIRSKWNNKSKY